jgi:hypothetical protein
MVALKPFLPCPSDFRGKDQLIEELDEFVRVNEVEHIELGAFAEDLLVYANPILPDSHVVSHYRITPPHMERKRDDAGGLGRSSIIELFGYRDGPSSGSKREAARSCHCSKSTTATPNAPFEAFWRSGARDSTGLNCCPTMHVLALWCTSSTSVTRKSEQSPSSAGCFSYIRNVEVGGSSPLTSTGKARSEAPSGVPRGVVSATARP